MSLAELARLSAVTKVAEQAADALALSEQIAAQSMARSIDRSILLSMRNEDGDPVVYPGDIELPGEAEKEQETPCDHTPLRRRFFLDE